MESAADLSLAFFKASTYTLIGDGRQALFWEDKWIHGESVPDIARCLCQFVPPRTRRRQTVRQGLLNRSWVQSISGGVSMQAIHEYLALWDTLQDIQLNDQPDQTVWRWANDGAYSAKSTYYMLHSASTPFLGHKLIWKTWAPLRIKIFLWLAFRRRHWTGDKRARHGLEAREMCYLCDQGRQTIDHILAECPFTREVWFHILQALQRPLPQPAAATTLRWWRRLRATYNGVRRRGIDSLFALVCWTIWKERNARCFREASSSVNEVLQLVKAEADRWIDAGARGLETLARL